MICRCWSWLRKHEFPVAIAICISLFSFWNSSRAIQISLWQNRAHLIVFDTNSKSVYKSDQSDQVHREGGDLPVLDVPNQIQKPSLTFSIPVRIRNIGVATAKVYKLRYSVNASFNSKSVITDNAESLEEIYIPPQQEYTRNVPIQTEELAIADLIKIRDQLSRGLMPITLMLCLNYLDTNTGIRYSTFADVEIRLSDRISFKSYREE